MLAHEAFVHTPFAADGRAAMTSELAGRVAIVTGAARGIGRATAGRLLALGAQVVLWDVDEKRLTLTAQELTPTGSVLAQAVELTDGAAVTAAAGLIRAKLGRIDILVNNAGITGGNAKMWELDPATWRQVIEVNLTAPFLTSHAVIPHMIPNGWGRIVNVSSIAGKEGNPNAAHYSASKAGLIGLTKSLAKELALTGVLVNCITPAAARTEIFDQMNPEHIQYMLSKIPMGRFVEVEEVANMIGWLCSPACSFTTGAVFDISGGRAVY